MVKNTVFSIKKHLKRPLFLPENVRIDFRVHTPSGSPLTTRPLQGQRTM
jgi:hypothetical protein